mmetsp:Transcript_147258/g.473012  ORF Transcript_147258/g.473012 Transcript_147258/m.473012 type:complete len:255 (-) Transcript_147258:669-1433(-)
MHLLPQILQRPVGILETHVCLRIPLFYLPLQLLDAASAGSGLGSRLRHGPLPGHQGHQALQLLRPGAGRRGLRIPLFNFPLQLLEAASAGSGLRLGRRLRHGPLPGHQGHQALQLLRPGAGRRGLRLGRGLRHRTLPPLRGQLALQGLDPRTRHLRLDPGTSPRGGGRALGGGQLVLQPLCMHPQDRLRGRGRGLHELRGVFARGREHRHELVAALVAGLELPAHRVCVRTILHGPSAPRRGRRGRRCRRGSVL